MNDSMENTTAAIPEATIIGNAAYLVANFERTEGGWIAFKVFNSIYTPPKHWKIEVGSTLTESDLEDDVKQDCASGINIAKDIRWIEDFIGKTSSDNDGNTVATVWKVFIPDTAIIVVPDDTDGKIRTNEIRLLETVGEVYYEDCDEYWDDD